MALNPRSSDLSDMDGDQLRERLRERLAATGKRPVPLAQEIGKGRDYLTDILNGRKHSLTSDVLTLLANALDCDERYFTDPSFKSPGLARRPMSDEEAVRYDHAARHGLYSLAWRMWRKLSLDDLADETGLSKARVSDIEQGVSQPSDDEVALVARALGTNPGLLRINPFATQKRLSELATITEFLEPDDQERLLEMAAAFRRRNPTAA